MSVIEADAGWRAEIGDPDVVRWVDRFLACLAEAGYVPDDIDVDDDGFLVVWENEATEPPDAVKIKAHSVAGPMPGSLAWLGSFALDDDGRPIDDA